MSPAPIIVALVVALLVVIYAWSGMPLAWGIVMFLAVALVAVIAFFVSILPRWPG